MSSNCEARKQPVQVGTTSKLHKPKILVVNGISRAGVASGRNILLNLVDVLTSTDSDAVSVLKSVSVHLIFDADPSEIEVECGTSSRAATTRAEDAVIEFIAREKFTMVIASEFQSIGLEGSALTGLKQFHEKKLANTYLQNIRGQTNCSSRDEQQSTLINRINEASNGTVAMQLGLFCCARDDHFDQIDAVLSLHRTALFQLFLSARQGVAGVVTSQYSQPLDAVIKVTGTRRVMAFPSDR